MLKSWRFWLGLVISAVCLYFALQGIQLDQVAEALRGMNYMWLAPATLIFLTSYLARVFRWQLLFSPQKMRFGSVFNALNIGYFLSNILPARLGDFIRAYVLGDLEGVSKARALSTVVVERMSDGLTVVLVFAATILFVPNFPPEAREGAIGLGVIGIAAIVFLLLLTFQKERGMRLLHRLAAPFSFLQRPGLWGALESLIDGFAVLRSPRPIFGVGMWSLAAWILGGINFWVIMLAMQVRNSQGALLPLGAAFLVMTVTSLVVVVPSSPGYIGVFHFVATQTLVSVFGVDKSAALSYAIVMHAFNYIWLILLGTYSIWHEGLTYQRLQTIQ